MAANLRQFMFDLSKGPVNTNVYIRGTTLQFEVMYNGVPPAPLLSPFGYLQFDSNPPVTIAGAIRLNLGFLQDVRYVQVVLPQQADYTATLTVSTAAEVVGV
ncbi:MAG: hypothetical protein NUW37_18480 [Planctomycetes bacterium]|nr:hypothetical protein [Planctomycetota bacterium]